MSQRTEDKSSRRGFLKLLGGTATAGTAAAMLPVRAMSPEAEQTQGRQYAMVIDVRKCIGCQSCTVACKVEHDVPTGVNRCHVEYVEKGVFPDVDRSFLPRLCNHCSEPQCVSVCPTGATYKRPEDGIVIVDSGVCIGCKYCIQACPYDARFLNPHTGFADKCDFCIHRVSKGIAPACVETCIGGARVFGDLSDPDSTISRMVSGNPVTVLRREMGTIPNVYYIGADYADESESRRTGRRHVTVVTHRPHEKRR